MRDVRGPSGWTIAPVATEHVPPVSNRAPIHVVTRPFPPTELAKLIGHPFADMVKLVVDVDRRILAVGGELHADAEALLLEHGSRQEALWGGNYHPGRGEAECLVFTSLINMRPSQGNRGMLVQDPEIQARMRAVVFALLGRGEPLP